MIYTRNPTGHLSVFVGKHVLSFAVKDFVVIFLTAIHLGPLNQSINQSINQSVNQSVSQSVSQSINQSISQSVGRSVGQSASQLVR